MTLSDDLRRDRRFARRRYSSALMSNSKWRAVFTALADVRPALRQMVVKFIDRDDIRTMDLPWLHAPHAFVDSFEFGPFPLVAIEWIEIPAVAVFRRSDGVPAERHPQDIDAVHATLDALGKRLPIVRTSDGLRIVGHRR